jgi:hypothetical protein
LNKLKQRFNAFFGSPAGVAFIFPQRRTVQKNETKKTARRRPTACKLAQSKLK